MGSVAYPALQLSHLNPTDVNSLDSKAEIQLYIGAYDEAISNCERILAMKPDFLSAKSILAQTFVQQGKYSKAMQMFNDYLQFASPPKFRSKGHTDKANVYFLAGDLQNAANAIRQALEQDSSNVAALWLKARILLRSGDRDALSKTMEVLDQALLALGGLDDRWFWYHLQGEVAARDLDFEKAIASFQNAIDLSPWDRSFYTVALADAYVLAGQV